MALWDEFHGPNAAYVLELYDRFRKDPKSVDEEARRFFSQWQPVEITPEHPPQPLLPTDQFKMVGVVNLAQAIRAFGHLAAHLDPLGTQPPGDPSLDMRTHGLTEEDLRHMPASLVGGGVAIDAANAWEAIEKLRNVYCSTMGYDMDHIHSPQEREWLRHAAEFGNYRGSADPIDPAALLERLTQVEVFERFLHRIFPGKTRFSLEGLDMLVPILDEVVGSAAEVGIRNILLGMAHRGRLNILAHILNKPYSQILAEFKDPIKASKFRDDLGYLGDVKYHAGARHSIRGGEVIELVVSMAPNPSHLEAVNPVVEGMARAAGTSMDRPGKPVFNYGITLPVLIHGDAAFSGQGIVAETLSLSRIPGWRVGGTLHIIANNQLGYTTDPENSRSTLYASDMAKGFEIPIVHVNADDPEACIEAVRLGLAYRVKFQKDFLIDLIGYRRHGHNEGDEPAFTQPLLYQKIEQHPTVREMWANTLVSRKVISPGHGEQLVHRGMEEMQRGLEALKAEEALVEPLPEPPPPGAAKRVKTAVPADRLRALNESLLKVPEGFTVHRKLERAMTKRRKALDSPDEPAVDWAFAESLAFASILEDGIPIRFTGQDVERGTFGQRHAVFHDVKNGSTYTPLQSIPEAKGACEIRNSPLSEEAAIGFEYGYNVQEPSRFVLWEAQYGDFINGAQNIIDEFLVSARSKWGLKPSLVLLLPHGYEGAGPDHSSGRLERFLSLAEETNMRIVNCTTSAQYFHLLRRQAALLKVDPLPLIVMTPKSLLRHPMTASPLRDFSEGTWQPIIDDSETRRRPEAVRRLILCSGKINVDLIGSEHRKENSSVAIVRVEQLYPFRFEMLDSLLEQYGRLEDILWVQEEPENMGAWPFLGPRLQEFLDGRLPLHYIGRRGNPSPAEGSAAWHAVRQEAIVSEAFNLESHLEANRKFRSLKLVEK